MTEPAGQPETGHAAWMADLPPDLKGLVEAKGYRTPADVVQAYVQAERAVGADKIPLPRDGVWDETARERLGIPPSAEGYALSRPALPQGVAWDETFEKAALPVAHELGLTPRQVQGLMDFYAGHQASTFAELGRARLAEQARATETLKAEWGPNFTARLAGAARAARYFGGEDLVAMLEETGLGNDPHLVRAFARAADLLGEDTLRGEGAPAGDAVGPAEAMRKARSLMEKPAYLRRDHPDHADLVEEVQRWFERAARGPAA